MVPQVSFRQATAEDLEAIAEVFISAFPESVQHYIGGPVSPRAVADAFGICLDAEPEALFVAEADSKVAGYVFSPSRLPRVLSTAIWHGHLARMLWRWIRGRYGIGLRPVLRIAGNISFIIREAKDRALHREARIFSLAVHPDFHARGIGTRLLRIALKYLQSRGVSTVRLEVRPDNCAALHLYERLGFETRGKTCDSQGAWLIMLKELSSDADR